MLSAAFKVAAGIAVVATLGTVTEWKADLKAVDDSGIVGEATVKASMPAPGAMTDTTKPASPQFTADVNIKGAKDGASHPWHVHSGSCGSKDAPIVGAASDYAAITIGSTGEGRATATVNADLAANGQYLVNVHKSADDLTVISCGELKSTGIVPAPPPAR